MITTPWDLGLVIGSFLLNAVLLYGTYRYARQSVPAATAGASAHEGDAAGTDDVVECTQCGAENEPGYRFCRTCVSELPGATGYGRPGSGQAERPSM